MPVSEAILNEATRRLVERFHPIKVILFGSQARGTSDDRSDVDLLVICELPEQSQRNDLNLEMDRSLKGLRLPCDIVILTPSEYELERQIPGSVARPAWREGRVLYERAA